MAASRDRFKRRIGQLLLLALLVVPLRLSAHVHSYRITPSPTCSICTIASHWVTEDQAVPVTVEPLLLSETVTVAAPSLVASRALPLRLGRAPPFSAITHL